jgi:hypothetical protein
MWISMVLVAAVLCSSAIVAQDGLALMKVETGARPAGMGGAFTAVSGSPDGMVYNPAAAFVTERLAGSFGHVAYWENIRLESGHVAFSLWPKLSVHAGIRYASIGDIEKRGETPSTDPQELFDAQDASFKAGAAYAVTDKVTAGVSAGWYFEKIDESNGWAFNADLGVTVQATPELALGASAMNLGSEMTLDIAGRPNSRPIDLPTQYRVGAAYTYDRFLGSADLVYLDDAAHGHVGVEAVVHELFQVRAGYMAGYDTKNFTAGASFVQRNLTVDYAFVPYTKDLGTTHLFNLTFTL